MSFIIIPMPPPLPPAAEAKVLMMMDRAGCVLVGYTARGVRRPRLIIGGIYELNATTTIKK
jgi:hypothetical protein